jgi:hypothetical protein
VKEGATVVGMLYVVARGAEDREPLDGEGVDQGAAQPKRTMATHSKAR